MDKNKNKNSLHYRAVVIGVSAGGLRALAELLPLLPTHFPLAVIIVSHRMQHPDDYLTNYLAGICSMPVQDAENLEPIESGHIYISPPAYHLLIADDFTFNLSPDPRAVNYSRPSIDLAFETAAEVYEDQLIGIILTGANRDGAIGLQCIKKENGYTMVQDPKTAHADTMPNAAMTMTKVDFVGSLTDIAKKLCQLCHCEVVSNEK